MRGPVGYVVVGVVLLIVLYAVHFALRPDLSRRNLEIFTEMVYSEAFESYSANPILPDGMTMQPPVAGVVPRGLLPFRYGEGDGEAQRAGRELTNPLVADDTNELARGAEVYATYCVVCHDAGGGGRGPVVERGMAIPPPMHAARALAMPDGQMFHILTRGQNNMASYAAQLTPEERWSVILHVRKLQKEQQQ